MSERGVEALPPEIAEVLEREKLGYPEDGELKAAVLGKVEMAVALGGGAGGGGGGKGDVSPPAPVGAGSAGAGGATVVLGARAVTAIAVGTFLAGAVVGGLAMRRATPLERRPIVTSSPSIPNAPVEPSAPAASSAVAVVSAASATSLPPVAPAASVTGSAKPVGDPRGDLTREREVLDAARASLTSGDPAAVVATVEGHQRRWPNGQLAEEREVVWIHALRAVGQNAEAEGKVAAFRRAFPRSVLLPALDPPERKGGVP